MENDKVINIEILSSIIFPGKIKCTISFSDRVWDSSISGPNKRGLVRTFTPLSLLGQSRHPTHLKTNFGKNEFGLVLPFL